MDPKLYEVVEQAVADGFTRNTLFLVAIAVLISVVSGYLLAYVKRKAENLATKMDFEALKGQLEENTTLTEKIKQDLTKEFSLWEARFSFKRKQIEEFYSPLLFLVQRKNWIQKQQNERMELSRKEHGGQNEEWAKILKFFSDEYILPLRAEMADLFKAKSFLMDEEPESFTQFLRHDAENRPLYTLWSRNEIDGRVEAVDWPESFEEDIRCTKERLEGELRDLLKLPVIARDRGIASRVELH